MADIASRSRYATTDLVCDIHHIARSVLHQIGEEHCIAGYDYEASTSHGPSIRPSVSSTLVRMQPIRGRGRGRGRGRERVDRRGRGRDGGRGHGRDGGRGHGRDGESGRGTPEPTLLTLIPPILTPHPRFLYPHILTHHLPYLHTLTHHLPYPQTLTHLYHIRCRQSQSQLP